MAARMKELEAARKDDERQKKLAERKRAQELREAKKKLARELQGAQRMLTRSEQEVNKLTGQLTRTEQQAAQATVKKNREGEKAEEGIGRIRQKHGKVNNVLREKMANVGQARGRLAHVQFAMAMLEKGVIVAVGEDAAPMQSPDNTMLSPQQQRRVRAPRRTVDEDGNPVEDEGEEGEEIEGETEEDYEGEGSSGLREELEQLKEENQKLREHLADADKRCTTAVQLLQQAQEVLETRMDDMSTIDFKITLEREKEPPVDLENASTMQGSQDGSTQHSPSAQPAAYEVAPSPCAALPSLLAQPRPELKRIPVYAGTLSPPPNRMATRLSKFVWSS